MIDEQLARKAFETAINYLSISARSEKEVNEKLYKKRFHRDVVDVTIEKLKGYKYIDDEQYVSAYLSFYGSKYGRKQLSYKLVMDKGVDKLLVENIIADKISDEVEIEKGVGVAVKYIARKKLEKKDRTKLANWLFSKGFEWDIINKVLPQIEYFDRANSEIDFEDKAGNEEF